MMIVHPKRWIAGSAGVATAMFAVWLVPPTTPKDAVGTLSARPIATPYNSRAHSAASTAPLATALSESQPKPSLPVVSDLPAAPRFSDDAASPEDISEVPTTDTGYVPGDDPEVAFDGGYRWAQRQEVQSRRDCRQLADDAARDGCRAFLSDQRDSR